MAAQRAQRREGKEGNRWVNLAPTAAELSEWFTKNVEVDPKLKAEDYVGGVTLIPSNEKTKEVVGWNEANSPQIEDVWDLVFTPYIRVETRVKYFHDLMAAHDEWLGVIEPSAPEKQDIRLPAGFFMMATKTSDSREIRFVCCSMKVTVFKASTLKSERVLKDSRQGLYETVRQGKAILDPPAGTKVVPVAFNSGSVDSNALMKAETGAVGRALGMAGMLVIPGTGLATAEDVQEALIQREGDPRGAETAALPEGAASVAEDGPEREEDLRKQAAEAIARMKVHPGTESEFKSWAAERGFTRLSEVISPALRGMVRRAEKMAVEAEERANASASGDPPGPDEG